MSRRLLIAAFLGVFASTAYADIVGPPAGSYIRNQSIHQPNSILNIDSGTITQFYASTLTVSGLTSGRCVQTGTGGLLTVTSGACGGAAGGSPTQLQYNASGSLAGLTGSSVSGDQIVVSSAIISTRLVFWDSAGSDLPYSETSIVNDGDGSVNRAAMRINAGRGVGLNGPSIHDKGDALPLDLAIYPGAPGAGLAASVGLYSGLYWLMLMPDPSQPGNITLHMPVNNAAGSLTNDGSGNLTWATPPGGGDAVLANTQSWGGVNTYNGSSVFNAITHSYAAATFTGKSGTPTHKDTILSTTSASGAANSAHAGHFTCTGTGVGGAFCVGLVADSSYDTATGNAYAIQASVTGSGKNRALDVTASGGAENYALYVDAGDVRLPITSALLAVDSNGIIISSTVTGGSGSGIVSPGTFTWTNTFGQSMSTITVTNAATIASGTVSGQLTVGTLKGGAGGTSDTFYAPIQYNQFDNNFGGNATLVRGVNTGSASTLLVGNNTSGNLLITIDPGYADPFGPYISLSDADGNIFAFSNYSGDAAFATSLAGSKVEFQPNSTSAMVLYSTGVVLPLTKSRTCLGTNSDGLIITGTCSGGAGDNLGNHIATMTVTANYGISGSTIALPDATATTGGIDWNGTRGLSINANENIFLGKTAGNYTNTGSRNIAIGKEALAALDNTVTDNIGIGYRSSDRLQSGGGNIAIGRYSLSNQGGDDDNISIGSYSLLNDDTISCQATAVGFESMRKQTNAQHNTAFGYQTLRNATTKANNTAVGYMAGGSASDTNSPWDSVNASSAVYVGAYSGVASTNTAITNVIALGVDARVGCSNCAVIGSTSVPMSVGIGTTTPVYNLAVVGSSGAYVQYGVTVGSVTGAGLSTCGDATHALSWSAGSFGCQAISATGGGGGYAVEPATVTFNLAKGFTASTGTVTGAAGLNVTYNVNAGSMTGAGLSSCSGAGNALLWTSGTGIFSCASGYLTANQSITLSGDASGTGTTAITVTNAASQANIKTFTSSITVANVGGIRTTGPIIASSATLGSAGYAVQITSNVIMPGATVYQNGEVVIGAGLTLSALSVSLPVKTDANKKLTASAVDVSGSEVTGTLAAARLGTFTGDVTTAGSSYATTLAASIGNPHTWTGTSTFSSSMTVNNAAQFGGAGYAVMITSNAIMPGTTFYQNGNIALGTVKSGTWQGSAPTYQYGGTGQTTAPDDNLLVGNGSAWELKTLTDCTGTGKAVTYATASNAWGCNTITGGSGDAVLASTQVWTGGNTYKSSSTFQGTIAISSGLFANGSAGSSGQFLKSNGPDTVPSWVTAGGTGDAVLASTQIWTGGNTYRSSSTYNGTIAISSGLVLSGSAGTSGQVLKSNGPDTVPSWVTSSGTGDAVLASTQIWTGGNTYKSSSTFEGTIAISSFVVLNSTTGVIGDVLTSSGVSGNPYWSTLSPSLWTNTGTGAQQWTKPAGAKLVEVLICGGGGAGGGGSGAAAGSVRAGGGGGGGGYCAHNTFLASVFGTSVTVTIGAGATSVAGGASGAGTDGGTGTSSTFETWLTGYGGGGGAGNAAGAGGGGGGGGMAAGAGATTTTGAAGGACGAAGAAANTGSATCVGAGGGTAVAAGIVGNQGYFGGASGGGSSTTGVNNTAGKGGSSVFSAAAGGSGGGCDAATPGTERAGLEGGNTGGSVTAAGGGGAGGTAGVACGSGGDGTAGTAGDASRAGRGGGGGASHNGSSYTTGCVGGTGGIPGGGGGGGGGGTTTGGASGAGGAGAAWVWTYF